MVITVLDGTPNDTRLALKLESRDSCPQSMPTAVSVTASDVKLN